MDVAVPIRTLLVVAMATVLTGCNPSISPPNLFRPGPERYQQDRAVQFDPYPDQDMGPRTDGGRPLDYNRQIPTVEQSRFFVPNGGPGGVPNPNSWFGRRSVNPSTALSPPSVVIPPTNVPPGVPQ